MKLNLFASHQIILDPRGNITDNFDATLNKYFLLEPNVLELKTSILNNFCKLVKWQKS